MLEELSKIQTEEGHNFGQMLMAKLALEYAEKRLYEITPAAN